jgi:hypothetical protein
LLDLNEQYTSLQVPSKLLHYVQAGRPIIAYTPHGSPVERILEKSGIQYVTIDPLTPEELRDQQVAQFLHVPAAPRQASCWFRENFDARTQARTVAGLLDELLDSRAAKPRRYLHST